MDIFREALTALNAEEARGLLRALRKVAKRVEMQVEAAAEAEAKRGTEA
jgi:hypothetical protein